MLAIFLCTHATMKEIMSCIHIDTEGLLKHNNLFQTLQCVLSSGQWAVKRFKNCTLPQVSAAVAQIYYHRQARYGSKGTVVIYEAAWHWHLALIYYRGALPVLYSLTSLQAAVAPCQERRTRRHSPSTCVYTQHQRGRWEHQMWAWSWGQRGAAFNSMFDLWQTGTGNQPKLIN